MIYLDNAATTYPKPKKVIDTVKNAFNKFGANPGRSGHDLSFLAAEEIYKTRENIANFFKADGAEQVAFTYNCTHAINYVLKGILNSGDHIIISSLEHNAVRRPVEVLKQSGLAVSVAVVDPNNPLSCAVQFEREIRGNTKLIFCTGGSNVLGVRLPVSEIGQIAARNNILFGVDAAQIAGNTKINMKNMNIDFLCASGHKGLYGPMGTGILIAKRNLNTLIEGGTGSNSIIPTQPEEIPDRFESGTPNTQGIIGLNAGINFVKDVGMNTIVSHEMKLIRTLYSELSKIDGVILYTQMPTTETHVPVLSFNIMDVDSVEIASNLNNLGFAVRAGLHCTPMAHYQIGTLEQGTVRVAPCIFTTEQMIYKFIKAVKAIAKGYK